MALLSWGARFRSLLDRPGRVFLFCLVAFAFHCLTDGVLWRLWGLHREQDRVVAEISRTRAKIRHLEKSLVEARDPAFIEREARNRLDLVRENDLVFVFPHD